MKRSEGFTLVDLAVVLMCVAILVTLLSCAATRRAVELANQEACRANMRGIGTGILLYKSESDDKFPLLVRTGDPYKPVNSDSDAESMELLEKIPQNQAAMQSVWWLIYRGQVVAAAFQCPSDTEYEERVTNPTKNNGRNKFGWTSPRQFSYGIHHPYMSDAPVAHGTGGGYRNPAYLDAQLKGSFVIMSDKNPGPGGAGDCGVGDPVDGVVLKPSNHPKDGEAYMMFSGAADWKQSTEDSDVNGDCIYSIDPRSNIDPSTPRDLDDQYIIPHPKMTK